MKRKSKRRYGTEKRKGDAKVIGRRQLRRQFSAILDRAIWKDLNAE